MKTLLFTAALLIFTGSTASAADGPEASAACVARLKATPVDCFALQARFALTMCGMNVELNMLQGQASALGAGSDSSPADATCINAADNWSLRDHYQATLKQFTKNKSAQSMTKDFYAKWRSAMTGLSPASGETKLSYKTRTAREAQEVETLGERLKLEQ